MGRDLNELASYFKPLAEQLLNRCSAAGVPCRIITTGRTEEEQIDALARKVSWVARSKHQPQPPENKSEAIDIVPLSILSENKANWNPLHKDWQVLGKIGKLLGLRWGGDWVNKDMGHFEYVHVSQEIGPTMSTT